VRRLYVYRLDRLSRSGIRETFDLVEGFRLQGVELVTIADGFDLQGPGGEIVLAVMAWAAQQERATIRERIQAARRRKESKGESWGRPSRLTRAELLEIQRMRIDGATIREIAVRKKIPKSTVALALSRKPTPRRGPPFPAKTRGKPPLSS
jgi:DNA invertase Pin-like site-specific DNA recombinase